MRHRRAWPGVALLTSLALLLAALVVWGDTFLSPGPSGGIELLLQLWSDSKASEPSESVVALDPTPAPDTDGARGPARVDVPTGHVASLASGSIVRAEALATSPERKVSPRSMRTPGSQARYALDLGTFALLEDAERAEAQLNEAGFSTVRFRQQEPTQLFDVFVPARVEDEDVLMARLRADGFSGAAIIGQAESSGIRVVQGVPLRIAVRVAERLRSASYDPRVVAERARVGQITLRHGYFASREEAETVAREIARLGVAPEVVQIH